MQFKDYYQILGVEPNAGDAEIKTAYRRLARKYHPDVSKEKGAEEHFKEVNEAYEALRDPEKRAAYDQLRAQGYRPGEEVHPGGGFGGYSGGGYQGAQDFDFEDIFAGSGAGGGGAGFSDFFESLFRRQGQHRGPEPGFGRPPADTRARFTVPLEAVYKGESLRVSVNNKTLQIKIPKGIKPGQVIRLAGQGEGGSNLLLEIEYAPDPQFEVDGRNIIYTLPVAPWEAALGASIAVPTLGGHVELKIPANSEAGRKLRLRGRGLPGSKASDTAGDQIVELEIQAPVAHNDAQKEAYAKLADTFKDWKR